MITIENLEDLENLLEKYNFLSFKNKWFLRIFEFSRLNKKIKKNIQKELKKSLDKKDKKILKSLKNLFE